MKNIQDKIYEAYGYRPHNRGSEQPKDVVLHFSSLAPAYLFDCEFSGQISDGKYENARPYEHWRWIINAKSVVDGNEYYTASRMHTKNYSFADFAKYIEKGFERDEDYIWSLRIVDYGRLAKVLESMGVKEMIEKEAFSHIAEIFGDTLFQEPDAEFEDTKSRVYSYREKYTSSKLYSKKYFDAFKKMEYGLKDVKKDIKSMCKTINTYKAE